MDGAQAASDRALYDQFVAALSASHVRAELSRQTNFVQSLEQDYLAHNVLRMAVSNSTPAPPSQHERLRAGAHQTPVNPTLQPALVRSNTDHQHCYTQSELDEIDKTLTFKIPSDEDCARVFSKCASDLASANELPCAACEMSFPPSEINDYLLSDELLQHMRKNLTPPPSAQIPDFIVSQYDAAVKDEQLEGLLLYPPGVLVVDDKVVLRLCSECHSSILHGNLPRLAIANGNWIGSYPHEELPWIEEQLVALVSPCVSIKTVTGGSQRCLRSHHYVVKNTAGPILEMLPDQAASRVRVTMVGAMTPQQIAICKRRHTVNVQRAKLALEFLIDNHKSYQARYNTDREAAISSIEGRLGDVVEDRTDASTCPIRGAVVERIDDTSSYAVPAVNEHQDIHNEDEWVEENSIILDQAEQTDDYLVRQSTAFLTSRQWADCIDMFPTLFPGGCGGPKEPRKKPLSVTTWARRVLRLHKRRFQRHDVFLLLVFDYLALENARSRMFFRLKSTRDAIRAGSVTREAIEECVTYRQHLVRCQAIGITPDPPSEQIRQIINIQKGVEASEVAYYGSNRARAQARSDLFGYIRRFGPLHIFFTVSPDASGTYTIGVQSGSIDAAVIQAANAHLLPSKTERRKIATRHPVECARYFTRVMKSIVKNVLGWDDQLQAPVRSGGLFGIVKAFTGSAETQVSGDLHAHFVVWLHGLPTTGSDMEEKIRDDTEFLRRYLQLVDAVSTLQVPDLDSRCPTCGAPLQPLQIPLTAYQRQRKDGTGPVPTSCCTQCNQTFKSHDLLDAVINRSGDPISTAKDFILCAEPLKHRDEDERTNAAIILREVQTHYWHHTPSCFKVTKRTPSASVCRFLRPAPPVERSTSIDANLEIQQHRPIGSEYLNAYNLVLLRLFRCNHDVRFIINGSSKDIAAYICKYVMKPQNRIENDLAFRLGSMERVTRNVDARNANSDLSDRERGNKILSGLIYAMTNRQEMPATMAALLVLRGSAFWTSHPVTSLNVPLLLATLDNGDDEDEEEEEVSIAVDESGHGKRVFYKPNHLRAYWARPANLEQMCLVEVLQSFTFTRETCKPNKLWKVVSLRGASINGDEYQTEQERQDFYKTLLLLFKPHRQTTLLQNGETFEEAYNRFLETGPPPTVALARQYVTNFQDSQRAASVPDTESPEELLLSQHSALTGLASSIEGLEDSPDDEDDMIVDPIDAIPNIAAEHRLARYDNEIEKDPILADAISQFAIDSSGHSLSTPDVATQVDDEGASTGTTSFLQLYTTMPTRLEKLQECFAPVPWVDPLTCNHHTKTSLPRFAKIAEVSLAFELNPWQHYAFETAARHVLYEYLKAIETAAGEDFPRPSNIHLKKQLIGFMGGEAGAGKSTVIHALLAFARSWERVGSVETLSFTGVAAIGINGRTIHSARNLPVVEREERRPSAEMSAKFAGVVLTIIDEISMTDQRLLGRADAMTKLMGTARKKKWAGRHLLFCGDWKQIPPVGGTPMYQAKTSSTEAEQGYKLYMKINFVVFLVDNMRSRTDPIYTAILRRMRCGNLSTNDIDTLNTRVGQSCGDFDKTKGFFRPVVVATNALRCAVNYRTTLEAGRTGQVQLFEAIAKPATASLQNFNKFSDYDDHLTDRIPIKFLYFLGMPVMITHRLADPLLQGVVANGTIGHIISHELHRAAFDVASVDGVSVFTHKQLPTRLLVRVKDCQNVLYEGFPAGVIPVEPIHTSIDVEVPRRSGPKRKRSGPSMTIDQFPMVAAFACTPEKLQGQTCKDGVIISKLQRGSKPVSSQALYVAFSRTVSLSKLTLTHSISPLDLKSFKPNPDTVVEMHRLQKLVTVPAYFNSQIVRDFKNWLHTQHHT